MVGIDWSRLDFLFVAMHMLRNVGPEVCGASKRLGR